jgi:hypothetical protein
MNPNSVFCTALSRGRAGRIVLSLKEAKFANKEISALFIDRNVRVERASSNEAVVPVIQSAEVLYGVMAWVASAACHIIPGTSPIIAVGPIATRFADAGIDSVADGLIDFGVPESEARRYETRIGEGLILVSVHAENSKKSEQARRIFSAAKADDIYTLSQDCLPAILTNNAYAMANTASA